MLWVPSGKKGGWGGMRKREYSKTTIITLCDSKGNSGEDGRKVV